MALLQEKHNSFKRLPHVQNCLPYNTLFMCHLKFSDFAVFL